MLLKDEASPLRHIARAEGYPHVYLALASYQAARCMGEGLDLRDAPYFILDHILDRSERNGLVVKKSSLGSGDCVVRLTALGADYVRRRSQLVGQ